MSHSFIAAVRRRSFRIITLLLLSATSSNCSDTQITQTEPIKLGTSLWPGNYWIDVASDKGWFQEAGLNVVRVDTNGNYFGALKDTADGKIDLMGFAQYDLLRHAAKGDDIVAIAAMDYSDGAEALIARAAFKDLRSLRGKKVAVMRGTYLEYLFSVVTEREGLSLTDFDILDISHDEALERFTSGTIDAMLVWEPYGSVAKAAGGISLFSTADFPGLTYTVLAIRRDTAMRRGKDVAALLKVWKRASQYVREHPSEACQIVARLTGDPSGSGRKLMSQDRILDLTDNDRAFSYAAGFESLHGSWRRMNDFMLDRKLIQNSLDSSPYLDAHFIRDLH